MEKGLDITKKESKTTFVKHKGISESRSPEELKKAAETVGLDLTKNLPKIIFISSNPE